MNGGDEVNALVLDIGSYTVKAGYAGDDTPKTFFPSCVGLLSDSITAPHENGDVKMEDATAPADKSQHKRLVGNNAVDLARDAMEVLPIMRGGQYDDWDNVDSVFHHIFRDRLNANAAEHPILMAEPSFQPDQSREKLVELLFEQHGPPAVFLGKNAMLSSFAVGRQTSLIVDSGHDATVVAAVHDGYVLRKSIIRSPLGGRLLTQCMQHAIQSSGSQLHPQLLVRRYESAPGKFEVKYLDQPRLTQSFRQFHTEHLAADIKEAVCRVSDGPFSVEDNLNIPSVSYELPDGNELQIGTERFHIPELLFQPALMASFDSIGPPDAARRRSIPETIMDSINSCDVDVRRDLYGGIVLTGGTSVLQQIRERLERELSDRAPPAAKVKVTTPTNSIERRFGVWIGGSILASLGSFQQMWLSKAEYDEHGAVFIHKKSP